MTSRSARAPSQAPRRSSRRRASSIALARTIAPRSCSPWPSRARAKPPSSSTLSFDSCSPSAAVASSKSSTAPSTHSGRQLASSYRAAARASSSASASSRPICAADASASRASSALPALCSGHAELEQHLGALASVVDAQPMRRHEHLRRFVEREAHWRRPAQRGRCSGSPARLRRPRWPRRSGARGRRVFAPSAPPPPRWLRRCASAARPCVRRTAGRRRRGARARD